MGFVPVGSVLYVTPKGTEVGPPLGGTARVCLPLVINGWRRSLNGSSGSQLASQGLDEPGGLLVGLTVGGRFGHQILMDITNRTKPQHLLLLW
jgi:hypothetical protein